MNVREKFTLCRKELSAGLIERDAEIDLCLTALICQQNVCLVGAPGTAKSMLANALVSFIGGEKFSLLLTRFTTSDEVCGPLDVIGLKESRYRRMMDSYLPTAHVAFLDEIWKSSSAILNTLLQILNEKTVRDDGKHIKVPLRLCIAASNEWPNSGVDGGSDLQAIFDRFLFRKLVRPIGTSRGLERLLWSTIPTPQVSVSVDESELDQANAEARSLPWTEAAQEAYREIIHRSRKEGIRPGDRRLQRSAEAVSGYAWLNEGAEVDTDHMEVLAHTLWEDPTEQSKKIGEIISDVAAPSGMKVNALMLEAEEVLAAADMKDLAKASTCDRKLGQIEKTLSGMGARAESARDYVKAERARMRRVAFQGAAESV